MSDKDKSETGEPEIDPTKVVGTYAEQPDPNAARPAPQPNVPEESTRRRRPTTPVPGRSARAPSQRALPGADSLGPRHPAFVCPSEALHPHRLGVHERATPQAQHR